MRLITRGEAIRAVSDMMDGEGKKVDAGVFDTLVYFTQVVTALGIVTELSCEGHFDWGNPYPMVTFLVPCMEYETPSGGPGKRRQMQRHNRMHRQNAEEKTTYLLAGLTRELVRWQAEAGIKVEHLAHFEHTAPNRFQLQPVFTIFNHSIKSSGDHQGLGRMLTGQRETIKGFAQELTLFLKKSDFFVGIPPDGCPGCLGKI